MARVDLESRVADIILDASYDDDTFDADALRETVIEYVDSAADSAVVYHSWALEVISEYERHDYADPDGYSVDEKLYGAAQWQEAATAYAAAIAHSVLSGLVGAAIDGLEKAAGTLEDDAWAAGFPEDESPIVKASRECPHGWSAHNREDEDGTYYWVSRQLDGCNAVAVQSNGVWLSVTWLPADGQQASGE